MARYLFCAHDGVGPGHTRRNALVARAVLARDPAAQVTIVTGLPLHPNWLGDDPRLRVVRVPALIADPEGGHRTPDTGLEQTLARRADTVLETVRSARPHVVVVDRHPFGVAGELLPGLDAAAAGGAALVLGLRDVLDEQATVRAEPAGGGWSGVARRFDEVLVHGDRVLCDHEGEYGLPVVPRYCGWVTEVAAPRRRDPRLLAVAAGGGGDGGAVFRLGAALVARTPGLRAVLVAGPYATRTGPGGPTVDPSVAGRLRLVRNAPGCAETFAAAGSVLQTAGYDATAEALAAGLRPVLVPRRGPRRGQAVRAARLAGLGLADVVDEHAAVEEVARLLRGPRLLAPGAVAVAGITLDGAARAATVLTALVPVPA
ncbi:hypothetical protein [Pseudonocardia hydrocarbonoxydans]|uniref:Membrane protein n=1 Tax=Pseudonocardia hydrocarbonoxydans TaxID=76726 RepID=A0A4Y3WHR4_9PSEU|nr:hypothetical protein [Pseudonocardia hydrocarbonoxydans]GEC18275.1 membrane protein [Pseudonocardia hydrocarbonoxydans]